MTATSDDHYLSTPPLRAAEITGDLPLPGIGSAVLSVGDIKLSAVVYDGVPSDISFFLMIGSWGSTISATQISDLRQLLNDSETGRSPEI